MVIIARSQSYPKDVWNGVTKGIKRFFTTARISRVAFLFLLIFLFIHYFTDHFIRFPSNTNEFESNLPYSSYKFRDLKHLNELNRIKRSVSNELRDLESKRNHIQEDINARHSSLTKIEETVKIAQSELDTLKREIIQLKNEQREAAKPEIAPPARLLASVEDNVVLNPPQNYHRCEMHNCFDYSRCSLTSQFPVYVYPFNSNIDENGLSPVSVTSYIMEATKHAFSSSSYVTSDPNTACLFIVVIGEVETAAGLNSQPAVNVETLSHWLHSHSHWHGDGRNHVLVYLTRQSTAQNPLLGVDIGRASVAQSVFLNGQFRRGFDVVLPTLAHVGVGNTEVVSEQEIDHIGVDKWKKEDESWQDDDLPLQVPALREYMMSFQGQWVTEAEAPFVEYNIADAKETEKDSQFSQTDFHDIFLENLKKLKSSKIHGKFYIDTRCPEDKAVMPGYKFEWALCGTFSNRALVLSHSTFALVPASEKVDSFVSTSIFVNRLTEALRVGAVPVIVGTHAMLPFGDFVNWEKAAVIIPQARISELSFLLENLPHAEILYMRRQGRFIFDSYFSTTSRVIESLLAVIRTRLQIPPLPVSDTPSSVIDHLSYKIDESDPAPGDAKAEFGFPPPEPQINSPMFVHNFTGVLLDARDSWNNVPGPFQLFPNEPTYRSLPTDAQFIGSSDGFRPIGGGEGGTGAIYQESLGGNYPREQFTIVMLTYEREEVLRQAVERLHDLPHLNKVVVVWNSPSTPSNSLRWPDIGVEVAVIKAERNSLNNRFVPWDEIKTDAVLSIDDDAHLRHDEILFGFRVWRESRNRVVGFPGRFHAWDARNGKWAYNSNYTCELSMVLTGAAFFHKYYMYLYTYWMPKVIRETVDEFMNCEDIAMNFLVSHISRLPPVKVTSRWTFRCPGCPMALSQSQEHFDERHKCINRFVKVFGYMPLIYTQFRVDSILFKTRLPHDKQKCFKFI